MYQDEMLVEGFLSLPSLIGLSLWVAPAQCHESRDFRAEDQPQTLSKTTGVIELPILWGIKQAANVWWIWGISLQCMKFGLVIHHDPWELPTFLSRFATWMSRWKLVNG